MIGMEPKLVSTRVARAFARLTHGHGYTEQPTNDTIDFRIDLLVASLRTVHGVIDILAHAQTEQVGLANNEVQVLIVNLLDAFRCAS